LYCQNMATGRLSAGGSVRKVGLDMY